MRVRAPGLHAGQSPFIATLSLNQGRPCASQIHSHNFSLTSKDRNVLLQGSLLDAGLKSFGDLVPCRFERQGLSWNTLIYCHNVKAVARLDQFQQNSACAQPEKRALEFRNSFVSTDLPEIAALLS